MYKFVTLYRRVDDEQMLEDFFSQTHLPLAEKLPSLIQSEVSRISQKPGGESRFHMMYELYFESKESFEVAMATPIGIKLIQALKPWSEAKIITWFFADAFAEEVDEKQPD